MIRGLLLIAFLAAVAGCSSGGGTTTAAAPTLLAPAEFEATNKGLSTQLKWKLDPKSVKPKAYTLFRNGKMIRELSGKTTEFEDPDLKPGKTYEYELRAEAGEEHSERAASTVTMPALTLDDARLDGYYDVDSKVTSSSGYERLHMVESYGWTFTPTCNTGPCDARWHGVSDGADTTFKRAGNGKWTGKWRGPFDVYCGKLEMRSDILFKLQVTAARAIEGEWVATRFKGTFDAEEEGQLGCSTTSERTERFVGRLS